MLAEQTVGLVPWRGGRLDMIYLEIGLSTRSGGIHRLHPVMPAILG